MNIPRRAPAYVLPRREKVRPRSGFMSFLLVALGGWFAFMAVFSAVMSSPALFAFWPLALLCFAGASLVFPCRK
jgi:hypothetical protein